MARSHHQACEALHLYPQGLAIGPTSQPTKRYSALLIHPALCLCRFGWVVLLAEHYRHAEEQGRITSRAQSKSREHTFNKFFTLC